MPPYLQLGVLYRSSLRCVKTNGEENWETTGQYICKKEEYYQKTRKEEKHNQKARTEEKQYGQERKDWDRRPVWRQMPESLPTFLWV